MDIIVVGGSAAGLTAAITAAKQSNNVTILEHKDRVGKKILATGNGRCNMTNLLLKDMENAIEYGEDKYEFASRALGRFGVDDTLSFFNKIGVLTKDRSGLVYPYSDQASAVLDALRFEAERCGVRIVCNTHVRKVAPKAKGFEVISDGGVFKADRVIIATGLKAQPALGSDGSGIDLAKALGHTVNPVLPGLCGLKAKGDFFKSVAGVRAQALLTLWDDHRMIRAERGEVQFTSYGLSGIVVMNLSNYLGSSFEGKRIRIRFFPDEDHDSVRNTVYSNLLLGISSPRPAWTLLGGLVPKKIAELFFKQSGVNPEMPLPKGAKDEFLRKLAEKLTGSLMDWDIFITGKNSFEEAQICLGGVSWSEVTENMESRIVPGVFFAGEILDIHGPCGGYNLQMAFTTGAIAGMAQESNTGA